MRSLRLRLILGSSLVAVIPLALAMILLSRRIENTVRAQAAERLKATLGALELQLGSDGERMGERLQILGRDPVLKRLYLLRPAGSRDLSDYLAERRTLLGLDFLQVADTSEAVIAEGSSATSPGASDRANAGRLVAAGGAPAHGPGAGSPGSFGLVVTSLADGSALAMTASAPIRYENTVAGSVHGGLVFDASFVARLKQTSGMDLLLRDSGGHVVASTLGDAGAAAPMARSEVQRVEWAGRSYLSQSVTLQVGTPPHAGITGLVSTASADRTIAALQLTSGLLGALGLALAVLLGVLWSLQVSRPVERLAAYSDKLAHGEWDEPLTLQSVRELQTLVSALDRMRRDLQTYRDRLVTSERQAAWSQMARKVAHEIKNPLTPIAVSVADLKRSFEAKRADFPEILDQAARTIAEEVEALKRLLQEFSDFARFPAPRLAPCRLSDLLTDLETLYSGEVAGGRLAIVRPERDIVLFADAGQMRQALVNLIKNGLEALDGGGQVTVAARLDGGTVQIEVSDTGPGLGAEQRANLFVPGFTTKAQGSGLGLTIVERIVNDHQGTIAVEGGPGRGTAFRIRLPMERSAAAPGERNQPGRT